MKDTILELYRKAKSKDWTPWELQTELKKICDKVIAVGDDLSFTLKLDEVIEKDLTEIGGRKCKIYPFRNAYRFDRGYVALDGKFIRISINLDEKLLSKILDFILPEG